MSDGSDIASKAEMFSHYTYVKSGRRLMVLDIQGAGYSLCDPEIASAELVDDDANIYSAMATCQVMQSIHLLHNMLATSSVNSFVCMKSEVKFVG